MAKKKSESNKAESYKDKKWVSVPTEAFKLEEEIKEELKAEIKRGEYEEKVAVDLSFEELIKLSVTDVDKKITPNKKDSK